MSDIGKIVYDYQNAKDELDTYLGSEEFKRACEEYRDFYNETWKDYLDSLTRYETAVDAMVKRFNDLVLDEVTSSTLYFHYYAYGDDDNYVTFPLEWITDQKTAKARIVAERNQKKAADERAKALADSRAEQARREQYELLKKEFEG